MAYENRSGAIDGSERNRQSLDASAQGTALARSQPMFSAPEPLSLLSHDPPPDIHVRRWPTERPLLILNALATAGLWYLFLRSLQSIPIVAAWAAILWLMNVAMITAIRGSAVRLGPDQFPELHARVGELARRMGLRRTPDVYLMQQDGALNAFATRFVRTQMVVLLSDLLEACRDDTAAMDMIIGHELGHIRAGHLRGRWLLMPASFVPFLGSALSRAREYTCDRYGCAAAGDREGALAGLTILSAGGRYGPLVNRAALMNQRRDLSGAWMVVGEWLGSHPPLSKRVWALAPDLEAAGAVPRRTALRGVRVALAAGVVLVVGVGAISAYLPRFGVIRANASKPHGPAGNAEKVGQDLERLKTFIEADRGRGRPVPWDVWELYGRWAEAHPGDAEPLDSFSGYWYDYECHGDAYRIWSTGPDGENHTADDIVLESGKAASTHRRFASRR
jgi:Zn-dependent protease with chaperone function